MPAHVLILNPQSGNGRTGREAGALLAAAQAALGDVEVLRTERPGHATVLCREALRRGARCILAVGGDGTNNGQRLSGRAGPCRRTRAFIPRGTGGDFRRSFGWGKDLHAALQRAALPGQPTDVGVVEFQSHQGGVQRRAFINIASAGLSGVVDQMVNTTSKALGPASFFVGSLRGLMAFHPYQMKVTVDGKPLLNGKAALCAVANGRYFGGGMQVAPMASVDDGKLSVVCLPDWGSLRFVAESLRLYAGDITRASGVVCADGTEVHVESTEDVLLDVDGEQPGKLNATFRVLPGALRMCR